MKKYYFTYGRSDEQPFSGGWSEVYANTEPEARDKHIKMHGLSTHGMVRCSSVYSEAHFKKTEMYERGNFGERCHETIE